MPTYATTSSLVTHMIGADLASTLATSRASECLDRAEARIDGVLARRYDLSQSYFQTTTATPPLLNQWTIMMGAGFLWQELARAGAGKESMARGKGLIECVNEDLELLREHKIELVNLAGVVIPDMSNGSGRVLCNTSVYSPTFNEGSELGWKTSRTKRQAIIDDQD